jgi:hypothetical protein
MEARKLKFHTKLTQSVYKKSEIWNLLVSELLNFSYSTDYVCIIVFYRTWFTSVFSLLKNYVQRHEQSFYGYLLLKKQISQQKEDKQFFNKFNEAGLLIYVLYFQNK